MSGRRRKPQFELADKLEIKDYDCIAGGCRLTDPNFSSRLKESFSHQEDTLKDIKFINIEDILGFQMGQKLLLVEMGKRIQYKKTSEDVYNLLQMNISEIDLTK